MGLSYTQLYDLVRRERSHQELQELPLTFYEEAQYLLHELSRASQAGALLEAEQARIQLVNTKKLLKQLYELREEKLLRLAQSRCKTGSTMVDTSKILAVERDLYEQLVTTLSAQRTVLGISELSTAAPTRLAPPEPEQPPQLTLPEVEAVHASAPRTTTHTTATTAERITIRVIRPVPAFVGKGMETYGPFAENERVELPESVAQVLIRKGTAQKDADDDAGA